MKFAITLILIVLCGCTTAGTRFTAVVDAPNETATNSSLREVTYQEPRNLPQGNVRVRSLGLVDLRPKGENTRIPAFHMRLIATNQNGLTPWTLNAREQTANFLNRGSASPIYINSDSPNLPEIEIAPGQTKAVDLYFAPPSSVSSVNDVTEFNLRWLIHAGQNSYAETTTFNRVESVPMATGSVGPSYIYDPYPVGYGPYWWDGWAAPPVRLQPSIRLRQ